MRSPALPIHFEPASRYTRPRRSTGPIPARRCRLPVRARALAALVLAAVPYLFSGCTGAPPQILEQKEQLLGVNNLTLGSRYEQLSVFVRAQDEDGFSDLEYLYVINDAAGLYWTFTPDTWEKTESGGSTWIGSSSIVMADYSALPRGEYRVVLVDLSGARDEKQFAVAAPALKLDSMSFPILTVSGDRVQVHAARSPAPGGSGAQSVDILVDEGATGTPSTGATVKTVTGTDVTIPQLTGHTVSQGQKLSLYVAARDEGTGIRLISGPYRP